MTNEARRKDVKRDVVLENLMSKTKRHEERDETSDVMENVAVVPVLTHGVRPIQSNDVNCIRGGAGKATKYDGIDPATRRGFRAAAKRAGISVDAWMLLTGNDNVSRGRTARGGEMDDAKLARQLGIRHGNLSPVKNAPLADAVAIGLQRALAIR